MKRIGLFICHCGINIASVIDIEKVKEALKDHTDVVLTEDYKYICSEPGQEIILKKIAEENIDAVVVAACSPTLHENTFRRAINKAGLNPYLLEVVNIREQCSWVHTKEKEKALEKAISLIMAGVEKVKRNAALETIKVPVTKRALVIGAGISGIQASLDIANSGYEVILVDKEPSIGGHMAQLSETFPTLDCSQCIMTPKMVEIAQNENIKLMTYSEVEEVSGYIGNFKVKIKRKPAYIDWEKCNGCGLCIEKCPSKVPSEFNVGLGERKAIYIPFPQAVPNKPVIDRDNCMFFKTGKCKVCEKLCGPGAVNYEQEERIIEEEVGAIVIATGYDLYPVEKIAEYGGGKYRDVIDGLQFERLLSASGPTSGEVRRPSDSTIPKEVVFIQCVGSRDPENYYSYCSKVCCMYATKHAMLYKHRVPDGQAYVFYIDIRTAGKGYEEFYQRAAEEDGVVYIKGKVSRLYEDDGRVIVMGADTLTGKNIEVSADLVVLAMVMRPAEGSEELAKILKVGMDPNGFFSEAHPKLRPVEALSAGFYLAGCGQAPKDIPEAVAQASGAASKVQTLFSSDELEHNPMVSEVIDASCDGCAYCIEPCPYDALTLIEYMWQGSIKKTVEGNDVLCMGCGVCQATCPKKGIIVRNFRLEQLGAMVDSILTGEAVPES